MARADASRLRRSFSRLENRLEVPNLIDIQRRSFEWLVDTEKGGLQGDHRRRLADRGLHRQPRRRLRGDHLRRPGRHDRRVPREGPHLRAPADRQGRVPEPRDRRDPRAVRLHGRLPVDDRLGHLHHQRHRARGRHAAGALPGRLRDGAQGPREAGLHRQPDAGPRLLARARDRQEGQASSSASTASASCRSPCCCARWARCCASRGTAPTSWTGTDEDILALFDDSLYIRNTIESDTEVTKSEEGALIELFKKQRPGEPPSVDAAKNLLNQLFFDPKRYDLTRVGRYKLNSRLHLDEPLDTRTLTPRGHRRADQGARGAAQAARRSPRRGEYDGEPIKDYAAEAQTLPREPIEERLDEYEHFGNRRLRTVGELIQEAFRIGLYRMERVVRERLTTEDSDTITPADDHQHPPGRGGPEGVLRVLAAVAVHGPDQLAVGPDPPPPPQRARRRRPHARARAHRGARRAPDPLRPHVPDRDPGGPEHRPDRLAVLLRARSPSTAS